MCGRVVGGGMLQIAQRPLATSDELRGKLSKSEASIAVEVLVLMCGSQSSIAILT